MQQAIEHSPAQLRLISEAAGRLEAADGLMAAQATYAGTAGTVSKEGGRIYERFTKTLAKRASHG